MNTSMYYVLAPDRSGESFGPYSLPQLKAMLAAGTVSKWHLLAQSGDKEWIMLENVIMGFCANEVAYDAPPKPRLALPASGKVLVSPPILSSNKQPSGLKKLSEDSPPSSSVYSSMKPEADFIDLRISSKAWGRGNPITGWLCLLALGVYISPIWQTITALNEISDINRGLGDASFSDLKFGFKAVVFYEMIGYAVLIALSMWRVWLFFEKRVTFKRMNTAWFIGVALFNLLLVFFCNMIGIDTKGIANQVGGSVLFAAIWIPYTWKSKQVKASFVRQ